jgi:uncharacterized membrane protein YhhN
MKNPDQRVYLSYILLALADIYCLNYRPELRYLTKPLLMPALMLAYVLENGAKNPFGRKIIMALGLSWLGDLALMFHGAAMFMAGLTAFLAAHIVYILYFRSIRSQSISFLKRRPVMLLAVIVYTFELLYILWPGLNGLAAPVTLYAIVISTMLAFAGWQYGKLADSTATMFLAGAFFFVLSDSILAVARFRFQFNGSGTLVMATYCLAQFLIVKGSTSHLRELSDPGPYQDH